VISVFKLLIISVRTDVQPESTQMDVDCL